MIHVIGDVLDAAGLRAAREVMADKAALAPGAKTAGWRARARKNNLQAEDTPAARAVLQRIAKALDANEVFKAAARPKAVVKLLLSRYEPGMAYGTHVDDAVIAGQRTDVSFTLFLADPTTYEGGELVLDLTEGERAFRLPAGHMVVYPSTTLHRVEPVSRGVRLAAVGWVRSLIRAADQRELLFDLDRVVLMLRQGQGGDEALDLVLKTRGNLLRRWLDD
jgi:PKHD-type hydroxylase